MNELPSGLAVVKSYIGPATAITGALYYFGWVRTRAVAEHFGLNPELLGYSTTDYILRSTSTTLAAFVVGASVVLVGRWYFGEQVKKAKKSVDDVHKVGRRWSSCGRRLLPLGVVGMLVFQQLLAVSHAVAFGAALLLLIAVVLISAGGRLESARWISNDATPTTEQSPMSSSSTALGVLGTAAVFGIVFISANALGGCAARTRAGGLIDEPGIVLTSQTELNFLNAAKPVEQHQRLTDEGNLISVPWRYRYDCLRLYVEANDRLFLLPYNWTENRVMYIVDMDETVRVDIDARRDRTEDVVRDECESPDRTG